MKNKFFLLVNELKKIFPGLIDREKFLQEVMMNP